MERSLALEERAETLLNLGRLETARGNAEAARIVEEMYAEQRGTLRLRAEFPNVGVVIQAYLYRSEEDVRSLMAQGSRLANKAGGIRCLLAVKIE